MAYMKNPPPKVVAQDKTKFHCWAASLESWIDARKPPTPQAAMTKTQAELISSYKEFTGAKDGLMIGKAMVQLMFDFQMMLDLHKPATKAITAQSILNRLMMKSYLWLFYLGGAGLGTFLGHAEVIYGLDGFGADASLRVMDPWDGKLNLLPLSDLNGRDTVFVCWYENSPSWSDDMFRIMKAMSSS